MIRGRARGVIERVFLGNKKGSRPKKLTFLAVVKEKYLVILRNILFKNNNDKKVFSRHPYKKF